VFRDITAKIVADRSQPVTTWQSRTFANCGTRAI
jgi:hypothetical protein